MKKVLVIVMMVVGINCNMYSQIRADGNADSAYVFPDSMCIVCNGSIWQNQLNAVHNHYSKAFLLPFNQCEQDTCYYTRELRFCNFGFNIPANAIIDSLETNGINEGASVTNVIYDTVVQFMKNHTPAGNNFAYPYYWLWQQQVYYPTGLFGTTWTPQEINDPGFGLIIRAKNKSNDTVTAYFYGCNIHVWYSIPNGVNSPESMQNAISLYPNPTSGTFTLSYHLSTPDAALKIVDISGRVVYKQSFSGTTGKEIIDASALSNGMYFYQLTSASESWQGKVIVEK